MPINWCTSCKVRPGQRGSRKRRVRALRQRSCAQGERASGCCASPTTPRSCSTVWTTWTSSKRVKVQQRNWIGRSEGAEVDFTPCRPATTVRVYTTRPDTLFGATYMVHFARASDSLTSCKDRSDQLRPTIAAYREAAARKSDFERTELNKDKTGVALEGITRDQPRKRQEIPVWVSDYVLISYGTGAIMAVPAHDDARLGVCQEVRPADNRGCGGRRRAEAKPTPTSATGTMVNSGFLNGLKRGRGQARRSLTSWRKTGIGRNEGQLQAARLGILASALLGRAYPAGALRQVRLGARCLKISCR